MLKKHFISFIIISFLLPLKMALAYDQGLLNRIENRLNKITTMKSAVEQYNKSGQMITGTFYLSRPGKMRLQYDPPINDFIVATGSHILYWDDSLRQQSYTSIGSTIADIILRENLKFGGRLKVCGLTTKGNRFVKLCLQDTQNLDQGTLTLYVHPASYDLLMWKIKDNLGTETVVKLINPVYNISLKKDLFQFHKPQKSF